MQSHSDADSMLNQHRHRRHRCTPACGQQLRQQIFARNVVVLHQLQMAKRVRRDVQQIANVTGDAGQPMRHFDHARGTDGGSTLLDAQTHQILRDRQPLSAAKLHFASNRRGGFAQNSERFGQVIDIKRRDMPARAGRDQMNRPARDLTKPTCAVTVVTVE